MADACETQQAQECIAAEGFINKLSIIIGHCDLLRERAEAAEVQDAGILAGVEIIRKVACGVVRELKEHGCGDLDPIQRTMMLCEAVEEAVGRKQLEAVAVVVREGTVHGNRG